MSFSHQGGDWPADQHESNHGRSKYYDIKENGAIDVLLLSRLSAINRIQHTLLYMHYIAIQVLQQQSGTFKVVGTYILLGKRTYRVYAAMRYCNWRLAQP